MGNVLVLLVVALVAGYMIVLVRRHRRSFVPQRGTSVGADIGALSDQPRVRVLEVTKAGPDRVHVVLTPDAASLDGAGLTSSSELDFVVLLHEEENGFELLQDWKRSGSPLGIVMPPGGRLVRLRSIDSLQPLTLRRAGHG